MGRRRPLSRSAGFIEELCPTCHHRMTDHHAARQAAICWTKDCRCVLPWQALSIRP